MYFALPVCVKFRRKSRGIHIVVGRVVPQNVVGEVVMGARTFGTAPFNMLSVVYTFVQKFVRTLLGEWVKRKYKRRLTYTSMIYALKCIVFICSYNC